METSKRDYVKEHLSPMNRMLNKHGGRENKIGITWFGATQAVLTMKGWEIDSYAIVG